MGSSARQNRQHLGLAIAWAVCALVSVAVSGSTSSSSSATIRVGQPKAEFILARLAYNDGYFGGRFGGRGGGGSRCFNGGAWTTDAPEAEFHLTGGIRRLTRIDTIDPGNDMNSCETIFPVRPGGPQDPRELDIFDYPFMYGVEVGRWYLDDEEAAHLRQYLLRGGFLMVDDFHGDEQWEEFAESMERVFPDRKIVEIPDTHEAFHVLYDIGQLVRDKVQIPGLAAMRYGGGNTCEECDRGGATPHWRGIFDDTGRLMVAINFNMDLGDAWEHADSPEYKQSLTALAYRIAISYALYAMSH
jgi:hypothetical protein